MVSILGISCYYHDAAAVLIRDGQLVAAAQEERFTRKKHDPGFPKHAIRYCLREAGLTVEKLDGVGFYDKPMLKFERLLTTYLATFPRSFPSFLKGLPIWIKEKLWTPYKIREELDFDGPIYFTEHHLSHAASAFLPSPYEEAAILTVDGVGEWDTTTLSTGKGAGIEMISEISFPHSLGLLYSAFTYYLGFKVNSAEYKVMGLAPYGEPRYADIIRDHIIDIRPDGSFRLNMEYFAYDYGLRMTSRKFDQLFNAPPRDMEGPLDQRHKDLAASVQAITEEIVIKMARHLKKITGQKYLCMAGGVSLNCVANGKVLREGIFEDIYVQPASGDAGGALGTAMFLYHKLHQPQRTFQMKNAYYGPCYSPAYIKKFLDEENIPYREMEHRQLLDKVAELIDEQSVIGWFQGRMEYGPRALGNRSILADARNPENKDRVNLKIKFRESFRPFAPSILEERVSEYFELDRPSPYMLLVAQVRPDHRIIPSVTHVDGSARIQTVNRDTNPLYYDLIKAFEKRTGCPVIINTSFNVRGEPIVCSPQDAYRCFMRTRMDYLVLDQFLLEKENQPAWHEQKDWREEFELD
jgi:carbamoyltransferase